MASSVPGGVSALPLRTFSESTTPKLFCVLPTSSNSTVKGATLSLRSLSPSLRHSYRVRAASGLVEDGTIDTLPEAETGPDSVEVGSDIAGVSPLALSEDAERMAPKQKIRIKLRSYWVPLIEDSCKQIMDAARTTNAKTMGPVPLPTKKRIYCVLKSPHVNKDARFHFEIRTHQRLIDILYPTAQTIDSLMQLDLPAGVDVEVKI
ncbi:30S ribosomal protein S10 [Nymphaea thermarum]|nr:30S ribosomal protein S10 [Nymphaea thermarum]